MPLTKRTPRTRPVAYFPMPLRMFLLASVSVAACVYALIRFYTHPHVPMLVPMPAPSGAADSGELPAPDIEVVP